MRLIDVDFVCDHIEKEIKDIVIPRCPYAKRKDSEYDIGYNNGLTMAKAIAMKAPTIEAAPVRHGRWVPLSYDGYADGYPVYDEWECSECHFACEGEGEPPLNYCPNCGTKMDGGVKE